MTRQFDQLATWVCNESDWSGRWWTNQLQSLNDSIHCFVDHSFTIFELPVVITPLIAPNSGRSVGRRGWKPKEGTHSRSQSGLGRCCETWSVFMCLLKLGNIEATTSLWESSGSNRFLFLWCWYRLQILYYSGLFLSLLVLCLIGLYVQDLL